MLDLQRAVPIADELRSLRQHLLSDVHHKLARQALHLSALPATRPTARARDQPSGAQSAQSSACTVYALPTEQHSAEQLYRSRHMYVSAADRTVHVNLRMVRSAGGTQLARDQLPTTTSTRRAGAQLPGAVPDSALSHRFVRCVEVKLE